MNFNEKAAIKYLDEKIAKTPEPWELDYYRGLKDYVLGDEGVRERTLFTEMMEKNDLGIFKMPWARRKHWNRFCTMQYKYGIEASNYFSKGLYDGDEDRADKMITFFRVKWLKSKYTRKVESAYFISNKVAFAEYWKEHFGRAFCSYKNTDAEFLEQFRDKDEVIVKPLTGTRGTGIMFFTIDKTDPLNTWKQIKQQYGNDFIAEEVLHQTGLLNAINASSVNTIRVVTLRNLKTGDVQILSCFVRKGAKGARVDNLHAGGQQITIEIPTGKLLYFYDFLTGKKLPDPPGIPFSTETICIPHWEEIKEFCISAQRMAPPGLNFIGWDVCMVEDGDKANLYMVEGNDFPGTGNLTELVPDIWGDIRQTNIESFGISLPSYTKRFRQAFAADLLAQEEKGFLPSAEHGTYPLLSPAVNCERVLSEVAIGRNWRRPDLKDPKTFNEKIQWMKLYASTPIKTRLADKYAVRDYIKENIGEEYLIPLLGVYEDPAEIDFDSLPEKFVIKTNHGYKQNMIVRNKAELNIDDALKTLKKWLKTNNSFSFLELHYKDIPPKIIIEEYLENANEELYDYKIFCFDGKPTYIEFLKNRSVRLEVAFYDTEWNLLPFVTVPLHAEPVAKPAQLPLMLELAQKLSAGFNFVRVDFYLLNDGRIKFGEMTFTPASGCSKFDPPEYDRILGDMIKL